MLTCERAAAVLRGLQKNELAFDADEIEELLALGLAVEADADDLATADWLSRTVRTLAGRDVADPAAAQALAQALAAVDEQLKGDWYRIKTSKFDLMRREEERVEMRRALAILGDRRLVARVVRILEDAKTLAPEARYYCCQALGAERYALTHKGWRVRQALELRLGRFANARFKDFLRAFDKNEAKMRAFGEEIRTFASNVGYVRKNPEQVVIGLAKIGAPAAQAIGAYHTILRETRVPDVAVTCTRNAAKFGGTRAAARRLAEAQAALRRAGFPPLPVVMGAAKSLLPFDPPDAGVPRYAELVQRLRQQGLGNGEQIFKFAGRLMPANGTPAQLVQRVAAARALLSRTSTTAFQDHSPVAVALASMVRDEAAVPGVVGRFRQIEAELRRAELWGSGDVALECVGCAGTPAEVVHTVASLATFVGSGRREPRDVAVAAAFAKRFAL